MSYWSVSCCFCSSAGLDCITPCAHGLVAASRAYWVSIYLANTWWMAVTNDHVLPRSAHVFPKVKCISVVWWFSQGGSQEPQDRAIGKAAREVIQGAGGPELGGTAWQGSCTSSQMLFHSSSWAQWTHNLRNWQGQGLRESPASSITACVRVQCGGNPGRKLLHCLGDTFLSSFSLQKNFSIIICFAT